MGSSIPTAWVNLHTLLVAETGAGEDLEDVQITQGPPSDVEEQQVIAVLGVQDPSEEDAAIGPSAKREERYSLELFVKVHGPELTPAEVMARGFAITDAIRDLVNTNRTLTSAVRTAEVASQATDGPKPAEAGGWVIFIRLLVACAARIS